jgi:integrase
MATFERRTDKDGNVISIRVKIRRKGLPATSKSFDIAGPRQSDINVAQRSAEAWARMVESEMDRGVFQSRSESEQTTLGECLTRYQAEVTPHKKGAAQEHGKINMLLGHSLANRYMASIRGADLAAYRDERLKAAAPATVVREMAILSHVFNVARKEWGMENLSNPIEVVRKPKLPNGRDRRLLPAEIDAIIEASGSAQLSAIMLLALETAMRRSEIYKITWDKVFLEERFLRTLDTKNGDDRDVPLSTKAISILARLESRKTGQRRVFTMQPNSISQAFTRARKTALSNYLSQCQAAGIEHDPTFLTDLRFHDARHEATSRLFEKGLNPIEAASVTGHKTLQMLKRYTHLKPGELAKKLG